MALSPERLGHDDASGRDLYLLTLGADEPSEHFALPAPHWLGLVVGATHRLSDGAVHRLAHALLQGGAVYLSAFGPAAERVHALLRDAVLVAEPSQAEETLVMTSAHDGPFEDALHFVLADALPSVAYQETCRAVVVVTVNAPAEVAIVRRVFSSPADFLARMATPGA